MNTVIKINFIVLVLFGLPIFAMEADGKQKAAEQTEKDLKLFTAIAFGTKDDVERALENGANINAKKMFSRYEFSFEHTPLVHAVHCEKPTHMKFLLEQGADDTLCNFHPHHFNRVNLSNEATMSVYLDYFNRIIKNEFEQALSPLLPKKIVDLICSKTYLTDLDRELVVAISEGRLAKVETLLQAGADPNTKVLGGGTLWRAQFSEIWRDENLGKNLSEQQEEELLRNKRINMTQLLLDYRANPDLENVFEMVSGHSESAPYAKLLLQHGADSSNRDKDGNLITNPWIFNMLVGNDFRAEVKDAVNKTFFAGHQKNDDLANIVADYVI